MAGAAAGRWREISGSHVFRSKLRPPSAQRLLRRQVLLDQLQACTAAPLTVVVGPAGTGKTSLMATWVAESRTPTAWFSADESDQDASHFWTGVIAALQSLLHDELDQPLGLVHRPGFVDAAVVALLEELEELDRPSSTLIIDNIHVIDDNSEAVSSLAAFLQHLPAWLHVVLLARRPPQLPLSRMRARGELGEIGFADLMFADDEAAELLRSLASSLDEDTIDAVVARAGGWAAGIQLAALAARSRPTRPEATEADRENILVSDYVWQEVFAAERTELVDALLDLSVVDRLNANLVRCLTDQPEAGALLSEAESRGLFVTRLGSGDWYEIHTLVRDRLRAELVRRSAAHASDLRMRAASWFEEAGEVALALDQWIRADRPREALRLLSAKASALYDSGAEATIVRTIARLPAAMERGDLEITIELAWSNLLVSRSVFLEAVDRACTWAAPVRDLSPTVRGRLTMLQSIASTIQGDWSRGGDLAHRALNELGDTWTGDLIGRIGYNMIAREVALSESWQPSEQISTLQHEVSRDPERRLSFEGTHALGESLAGHPVDALRIAAGVRDAATITNMSILRLELAAAEAIAHRELGDRVRAQTELVALGAVTPGPILYATLLADLELAQMHLDDGDVTKAEAAFIRAAELVEADFAGPGGRSWLGRVGTLLALAGGDLAGAHRWTATITDSFWGPVSRARVQLGMGNHSAALQRLDDAIPRCARHEVVHGLMRARTLTKHEESVAQAATAAELASAYGLVQSVAAEGAACIKLIELIAWRVPPDWLDRVRRAATATSTAHLKSLGLVETLTDREREVLRLLPSRLTLHEIADELFISMNTLKFHLKVIYRKLGCSSRAEAAAISQGTTTRPRLKIQRSEIFRR